MMEARDEAEKWYLYHFGQTCIYFLCDESSQSCQRSEFQRPPVDLFSGGNSKVSHSLWYRGFSDEALIFSRAGTVIRLIPTAVPDHKGCFPWMVDHL